MTAFRRKGARLLGLKTLGLALIMALFFVGHVSQSLSGAAAASNGLGRLRSMPLQARPDDAAEGDGVSDDDGAPDDHEASQPGRLAALETDADVTASKDEASPTGDSKSVPGAEEPEPSATLSPQDIAEAQTGFQAVDKAFKHADVLTNRALGSLQTVQREAEQLNADEAQLKKAEAEAHQVAEAQESAEKTVQALKQAESAALAKQDEAGAASAGDAVQGGKPTESTVPATNGVGALLSGQVAFLWALGVAFLVFSVTGGSTEGFSSLMW